MTDEHVCRASVVRDSIPPIRICDECGVTMPLTDDDRREYRDYTGRDYVDPPTASELAEMRRVRAAAGLGKP